MYLLYIDASGAPEINPNDNLYVMAGICVHEGTWFALEKRVKGLKRRYELPGIPIELHAKDFCISFSEQGRVQDFSDLDWTDRRKAILAIRSQRLSQCAPERRAELQKKYRATEAFIHLTRQERSQLLEDALDLVGSHDGVRLFAEAVDKNHLALVTGTKEPVSVVRHSFTQLVSRFDFFLKKWNRGHPGEVDNGLLMMDNEPTHKKLIQDLFSEFRDHGHPWGQVEHVIETPFFVDSKEVSAVQAVDLCAYVVRRYIERAQQPARPEEQNFLRIYHRFDREGPKLHGIRHYCERNSCQCRVCLERGHTPGAAI